MPSSGQLCYEEQNRTISGGINLEIPRTGNTGGGSQKRVHERCRFWSLTGFLSAIFFFLLLPGKKRHIKAFKMILYGRVDLQNDHLGYARYMF